MPTAKVQWIAEQKFLAVSPSGHALVLDSDHNSNTAPSPMELLLMALGACTATDIVIILGKKRQKLEALEVICSGERAAAPPQVWTKLDILFRLRGSLDEAGVSLALTALRLAIVSKERPAPSRGRQVFAPAALCRMHGIA